MRKRNRKQMAWLLSISLTMTSLGAFPGSRALADSPSVTTISDKAEFLDAVAKMRDVNTGRKAKYRLTGNITLDEEDVLEPVETFEGEFDGGDYTITGLKVQKDGKPAALFTTLQNSAKIKNVKLENVNYVDSSAVSGGLLVKKLQGTSEISDVTIENSKIEIDGSDLEVKPSVSSVGLLAEEMTGEAKVSNVKIEGSRIEIENTDSVSAVGLLAGKVQGDVVIKGVTTDTNSAVTVNSASSEVGGIVGSISGKSIRQCENHAAVTSQKGEMVGGIVGHMSNTSVVSCENDGAVTGGKNVGGIAGKSEGDSASLTAVMNKGSVEAKKAENAADTGKYVGGIAGEAGGNILHAGNTGTVSTEISVKTYVSSGGDNPYAGGIAGKGNSLIIINSYTAGTVGDLGTGDINATNAAKLFSTSDSGVTITHSYFLAGAEITGLDENLTCAVSDDFQNGKVAAGLMGYRSADGSNSGSAYWRQKIGQDLYPNSYHTEDDNSGKLVSVQFDKYENILQTDAENPYEQYAAIVNYGTRFSALEFYTDVVSNPENAGKYWVCKLEGMFYREVTGDTVIKKDVVFYVGENNGSGGTAPSFLPAGEDPEASDDPDVSASPDVSGSPDASGSPDVSASPEASGTPEPSPSNAPVSYSIPYVPSGPVVSDTPETSETPAVSSTPEVSEEPETSKEPEASEEPEVSEAPEASNAPETPEEPETSKAPEASSAPAESAAPEENVPVENLEDRDTPIVKGEKVESDGVIFTATGKNSVMIEKNTDPNIKKVTIPDTIEVGGKKYKVTSLGAGAYRDCKKLKTVKMGKNLKTLGKRSFKNCVNLKTVEFSENLKTLSKGSFRNCTKLKNAELPATTKTIGKNCFKNCTGIKKFTIGSATKKGGLKLAEDGRVMYGGTPIAISIAASALENCVNLKQVIINSQVQKIGNAAFKQCKALSKIIVYSLILKKVGKQALTGVHNCKISVPTKKVKPYKVLFKNKGQGKKVVVAKM